VKALSLWQPWASLIPAGIKLHETRSWPAPATIIGQRIAICSAKTDKGWGLLELPQRDLLARRFDMDTPFGKTREELADQFPLGVVVCTAVVVHSWSTTLIATADEDDRAAGDWRDGRWAWGLAHVRPVRHRVPVKGAQGIFTLQDDVVDRLRIVGAA